MSINFSRNGIGLNNLCEILQVRITKMVTSTVLITTLLLQINLKGTLFHISSEPQWFISPPQVPSPLPPRRQRKINYSPSRSSVFPKICFPLCRKKDGEKTMKVPCSMIASVDRFRYYKSKKLSNPFLSFYLLLDLL